MRFAIAGRNGTKLMQAMKTARENTGIDLNDVGMMIVDVTDPSSVVDMAKQASVVINCVGPVSLACCSPN